MKTLESYLQNGIVVREASALLFQRRDLTPFIYCQVFPHFSYEGIGMKIVSWNINGLMATLKNGYCVPLDALSPDVLCIQKMRRLHRDESGVSKLVIPKVLTSSKLQNNAVYEVRRTWIYIIKKYELEKKSRRK